MSMFSNKYESNSGLWLYGDTRCQLQLSETAVRACMKTLELYEKDSCQTKLDRDFYYFLVTQFSDCALILVYLNLTPKSYMLK